MKSLKRYVIASSAVLGLGGTSIAIGERAGTQNAAPGSYRPLVDDRGWYQAADRDGNVAGWINDDEEPIMVRFPESFIAQEGAPSTFGVRVVRDEAGAPVGVMAPKGFVAGGVSADGKTIDPDLQAQFVQDAMETTGWSIAPDATIGD